MRHLLLATHNRHKTREFAEILGGDFVVSDLTDLRGAVEIEETGKSFEENAILKAMTAARVSSSWVVADDSGLEVDALRGAPGIFSARYAGLGANDAQNLRKLLEELGSISERKARFRCALALVENGNRLVVFHGILEGAIAESARGKDGFGYDPIFIPTGYEKTLAELERTEKNKISHRAEAVLQLRHHLNRLSGEND